VGGALEEQGRVQHPFDDLLIEQALHPKFEKK
jgi:hypothetical protein